MSLILPKITYNKPLTMPNGNFESGDNGDWVKGIGWFIANGQGRSPSAPGVWSANRIGPQLAAPAALTSATVFPCAPFQTIKASMWAFTGAGINGAQVFPRLSFQTASFVDISSTDGIGYPVSFGGWDQLTVSAVAPAGAAFVKFSAIIQDQTANFTIIIDDIAISGPVSPTTLSFQHPPNKKPAFSKSVTRTDTFSTAGVRQTVEQWKPQTIPINMQLITAGTDATNWQTFLDYALEGGQFNYYPDATNINSFFPCFLKDTSASLDFVSPGAYKYSGTFQVEVLG